MAEKRILPLALAAVLLLSLLPLGAGAAPEIQALPISSGGEAVAYPVIYQKGELYFTAETYEAVTGFVYTFRQDAHRFTRGQKEIVVDGSRLRVPMLEYRGKMGKPIQAAGKVWFPASDLLPWMNVTCDVLGGELRIIPDRISLWDLTAELKREDYLYNFYEEFGDSVGQKISLGAMLTFDTLANLRLDRLIPSSWNPEDVISGNSVYDVRCYQEALVELGMADNFSWEGELAMLDDLVTLHGHLEKLEEICGIDLTDVSYQHLAALQGSGWDQEDIRELFDAVEKWEVVRAGLEAYDLIDTYADPFRILKMHELSMKADVEYRDYLRWLGSRELDRPALEKALDATNQALEKESGMLVFSFITTAGKLADQAAEKGMDALTLLESLAGYLKIAKVFYSTVIPVAGGYEAFTKVGVLQDLQNLCWQNGMSMQYTAADRQTVGRIRQSYLLSLKASRMIYEAVEDLMDVKLLGLIDVTQTDGLLDWKFEKIDSMLARLTASADATVHDSVEEKEEGKKQLQTLFRELTLIRDPSSLWEPEAGEETMPQAGGPELSELMPALELLQTGFLETYGLTYGTESFTPVYEDEQAYLDGAEPIRLEAEYFYDPDSAEYADFGCFWLPATNFTDFTEWMAHLRCYLTEDMAQTWMDAAQSGVGTYGGRLYFKQGLRGYGAEKLDLSSASISGRGEGSCTVSVNCLYMERDYVATYQVDFVYDSGQWKIAGVSTL